MTAPSEDIPMTATVEDIPPSTAEAGPDTPRLAVENLRIVMPATRGRAEADVVDQVSFTVQPGRVLGLVGESGSGKTSLAWAIMRYLPANAREAPAGPEVTEANPHVAKLDVA